MSHSDQASRPQTRSTQLLQRVLHENALERETLVQELLITPRALDAFLDGRRVMPLDRQLCLALLVIDRVPALARHGHALRAQVAAAIAYQSQVTATHEDYPSSRFSRSAPETLAEGE